MTESPYTPSSLKRRISYADKCKNPELNEISIQNEVGNIAYNRVSNGTAFCSGLTKLSLGKKTGYGFGDDADTVIARLLARNITSAYSIAQSNRQFLVSNTISIMKECLAYNVYRYDIQNFYESIDRKLLLEQLILDGACTWQTILLIRRLFFILDINGIPGLPRGMAISGVLAEYRLGSFDQTIRQDVDVFFYSRFVDDILIISSERIHQASFDKLVEDTLPEELVLHHGDKRSFIPVPAIHNSKSKNAQIQKFEEFSYLGYKIKISNNSTKDITLGALRREVLVDISNNKIQKIQSRLIKSFTNYISSHRRNTDFALLKNRIRAITGNYEIKDPSTKVTIKTGIYYSYIHKNTDLDCSLVKLDRFFRSLLFSQDTQLATRIQQAIPLFRRKLLIGYSFKGGYDDRRFHSFSYKSFEQIKKVWL